MQEALALSASAHIVENEATVEKDENNDLSGIRILIVEDNIINQQIADEILSSAGAKTTIAGNGQEAVDIMMSNLPDVKYDIILMDLQMPVMDGFEATKYIRNTLNLKNIPIIAMTAHTKDNEWDKCAAVGMSDYATKPINVDDLFETIQKWHL